MLWCVDNANIQSKRHVSTVFSCRVISFTSRTKINVVENRFCIKIPVFPEFSFVFPGAFKKLLKILNFNLPNASSTNFAIEQNTVEENRSSSTTPNGDDRQKIKKN